MCVCVCVCVGGGGGGGRNNREPGGKPSKQGREPITNSTISDVRSGLVIKLSWTNHNVKSVEMKMETK